MSEETMTPQEETVKPQETMKTFETGATRSADDGKPDYEGYLSPTVLVEFGRYMTSHRVQADGGLRASDNWQKGIPRDAYMKSMWRHFLDVWLLHRGLRPASVYPHAADALADALCALFFNVQGYLHEYLKHQRRASTSETPRALREDAQDYAIGGYSKNGEIFYRWIP